MKRNSRSVRRRSAALALAFVLGCGSSGDDGNAAQGSLGGTGGGGGAGGNAGSGGSGKADSGAGDANASGSGGTGGTGADASGGGMGGTGTNMDGNTGSDATAMPAPSCNPGVNGTNMVAMPELVSSLKDRYEESWLGSPAVADLDHDGTPEIVVPRGGLLLAWHADGSVVFRFDTGEGRIWSSPVVGDFVGDSALEVAVAARDKIWLLDASGVVLPGFPVTWEDEMRALAAADVDGDGALDLVATVGKSAPTDVVNAWHADGTELAGFPPNATGKSGCTADGKCYFAGCYDQNLAIGPIDAEGALGVVAPHDNAYASFFRKTGEAFDANAMFPVEKTPGVRYLHDLALAKQGYANDESVDLQAHFTNTAPAIADIDGDGHEDIVMLGSAQNAAQDQRELGVGLWVVSSDASRHTAFQTPYYVSAYLAGLWDYDNTNIVAATNQVTVADIGPSPGLEMIFAGFDGTIHAVTASGQPLWAYQYTTDPNVLTGGVVVGDLSSDGVPEIVFASYSTDEGKGKLFVLDGRTGSALYSLPLPHRGAMAVPTLAPVDATGIIHIVVSLKDADDKVESVRLYRVAGSADNCLLWPTGRANLLRNAWVPVPGR